MLPTIKTRKQGSEQITYLLDQIEEKRKVEELKEEFADEEIIEDEAPTREQLEAEIAGMRSKL